MADIQATFDKLSVGTVTFGGVENWVDLLSFGPDVNSPIPAGKQIWVGFITVIAQDKAATFEFRPNLPTKSLGNTADTQLRGFVNVPSGDSRDLDLYYSGSILTLAPVSVASTGVEKLWCKIKSASGASSTYEFLTYYTIY